MYLYVCLLVCMSVCEVMLYACIHSYSLLGDILTVKTRILQLRLCLLKYMQTCLHLFLPPWVTEKRQYWYHVGNKRLHYGGLRFVSRQEHLFPHCFGTFSISSFPFHFVLSGKKKFNMTSTIIANTHTLQWKYKPHFKLPTIWCQDYAKHNTATDTTAARGHKTYTCANENPEPGIFQTGKRKNHKTCPEIFMIIFLVCVFVDENLGIQRKILIISVNRSM